MRKILNGALLGFIAFLITAQTVMAATYHANLTVQETGGDDYASLALAHSWTASNLTSNGFMEADGLDSRVLNNALVALPHLIASDRLLFVTPLGANETENLTFTVGNTDLASMPIITGVGGYVTTADAAALEPANNFEIEIKGGFYAPTSEKNLITKGSAFVVTVDENMDISTAIPVEALDLSKGSDGSIFNIYGANWSMQAFSPTVTGSLTKIEVYLTKNNSPSGNFTIAVYAADANDKPTGSALCTGSVSASTASGTGDWLAVTFSSPASLTSGTKYVAVYSCPNGDASNYLSQAMASAPKGDVYTSHKSGNSTNSGSTWTTADNYDRYLKTYMLTMAGSITAASCAEGLHTLKIAADGTNIKIYYDGVEEDSAALAGASIANTADNWIWMLNDIVTYAEYIKYKVSGTLVLHYQPIAVISGTTLPDREGTAQNGTFTWGTNPADVDVTMGALISANQPLPAVPSGGSTPGDALQPYDQPGWISDGEVALQSNPFYPLVDGLSTASGFSDMQVWVMLASGIVIFAMLIVFKFLPHILAVAVTGGIAAGFFVAIGIYPFWVIFIFIVGIVAIAIKEMTPSV